MKQSEKFRKKAHCSLLWLASNGLLWLAACTASAYAYLSRNTLCLIIAAFTAAALAAAFLVRVQQCRRYLWLAREWRRHETQRAIRWGAYFSR